MSDEQTTENVLDRLLLALAAQLHTSPGPALAAGAVEAFADLSRAETDLIFGQAGLLVHYGADTAPLEALLHAISTVQRAEAPDDAALRPGDAVRLVGELPESLAEYDENWLRETGLVVRYVGRDATVDVQSDLAEDYWIATVPVAAVRQLPG
ncbi:hypothetical protein [Micromonospora tarensis]|uniref:Uncharacterized protein n=1 Tax=Micromonospora tarensis TaxID=2806100 RepID=A0ABS1YGR0_9ACTN|nr:hypothetical protein [Micromonospora tarensis]MBM0276604.1 hypothetical protein [Micromonospora tarensis]